jgi:hypothetical protein
MCALALAFAGLIGVGLDAVGGGRSERRIGTGSGDDRWIGGAGGLGLQNH